MPSVEVAGMGVLCSIASGVPAFYDALRGGRSGVAWLRGDCGPFSGVKVGAEVARYLFSDALAARALPAAILKRAARCAARASESVKASVLCALEAWEAAGLDLRPVDPGRVAVIVASDGAFGRQQYDAGAKLAEAPEYVSPRLPLQALSTDHVGVLSEVLDIRGEGFAVSGASASGNIALLKGKELIEAGAADVCLVVGALSELSPVVLQGLHNMGAIYGTSHSIDPSAACRPFDVDAAGFVYGQAAACIIVESPGSSHARGAKCQARFLGGAAVLDGTSSSTPSAEGELRAMAACLASGRRAAADIDYVNAHGTSTPLGDRTEIAALQQVLRGELERVWINSTKGLLGHCLSSAGVIEAVATVLQLQHQFVHPNVNLLRPIADDCRFVRAESQSASVRLAMSNSFGFGGINSSVLLERVGA